MDERRAKKAMKAMKAKEEMEIKHVMKFAQMTMGNMRAPNVSGEPVAVIPTPPAQVKSVSGASIGGVSNGRK